MSMNDAIAFFMTWPTYGTWLPGDERGWIEYRQGWQLPDPIVWLESRAKMKEDACTLSASARKIVEDQVRETCAFRNWVLHAVNCRSNHLHLVVGAGDTHPKKIRTDVKAWCTRQLRQINPDRKHWWAERGSERYVYTEDGLSTVVQYVTDAQARKSRDLQSDCAIDLPDDLPY